MSLRIALTTEMEMQTTGYSAADLKALGTVLDAAVAEAAERNLDISIAVMTRRLFDAARWGERNPERLKSEILGDNLLAALVAHNGRQGWASGLASRPSDMAFRPGNVPFRPSDMAFRPSA